MVADIFFKFSLRKIQDIYVISNCTKFELNRAIRFWKELRARFKMTWKDIAKKAILCLETLNM